MTFAAHGMIDVLPYQPLHTLITNVFAKSVHLLKTMVALYATGLATSVTAASSTPFHHFSIGAFKKLGPTAFSNVDSASCKAKKTYSHSTAREANKTAMDNQHTLVAAVHYESTIDKESRIWKHNRIRSDETTQLTKVWNREVSSATQYQSNKQPFLDILSQFKLMWDGHLGRVTMTKRRMDLLQPDTAPVYAKPYQAGSEMSEFKRAEIDKLLAKNIRIEYNACTNGMGHTDSIGPQERRNSLILR